MQSSSSRSGRYILQATGYRAFMPAPLPPDPPLAIDGEMLQLLSAADRALGRLDGSTEALPNPDLFVMMYIRKEALLSSQIEGTQASLAEVLELESEVFDPNRETDADEVINYIKALDYGLKRLEDLPLSLRLIKEIHGVLLEGSRGMEKSPGEFRRSQNWIGPAGCSLSNARFVPPPPSDLLGCLGDWEVFLHSDSPPPLLIEIGLAHAQFETIHPFLDGNGRVGRLLITFMLCQRGALKRPLLYISHYFKRNRSEYYDRLQAVREKGDWEGWIKFFLSGVANVADEASQAARKIVRMREEERALINQRMARTASDALLIHEALFDRPFTTLKGVQKITGREFPAASRLVKGLEECGILAEVTGKQRNRVFRHERYYQLISQGLEDEG